MALEPGTRFGPYEVAEPIGSGGMGEVYRAVDPRLERDVAIKVLPASVAGDAGRIARFEQEAKTLAALNHPNVAHIYGLEHGAGATALVMELVEGPTLADRIALGPLPADEALGIAMQIAAGLEAAHERGIVHRDLKPANIKVRPDGTVKILDFGIAKALEMPTEPGMPQAPSLTTPAMTQAGIILGTAAYMSPEQARGKRVDRRTDIWAYGCVLYEMLTGQPAFGGEDVPITLARVLAYDADMASMPGTIAPAVRHTLELCLRKDPKKRIADIADVRLALQGELAPDAALAEDTGPPETAPVWRRTLPWAAGLVLAALAGFGAWQLKPEPPRPVVRFVHPIPADRPLFLAGPTALDISPDGRRFVYNSPVGLVVREMDSVEDRIIPLTQDPRVYPTFSPDGQSLAFLIARDNGVVIARAAIAGGAIIDLTVMQGQVARGLRWEPDGSLIYGRGGEGVYRVSENGGEPERIIDIESDQDLLWPELLPGGEWVLFTFTDGTDAARWDRAEIVAQSLVTGERRSLRPGATSGRYVPTGHLVYGNGSTLFAVAFDPDTLTVSGGAVPVEQGVRREGNIGVMEYAFAADGTLVYLPGGDSTGGRSLAIGNGQGQAAALAAPNGEYDTPRASPDGRWVAYQVQYPDGSDIAVYEIGSNAAPRRLTFGGQNTKPVWSADGSRVAYRSSRDDGAGIWWRPADGTGPEERLTQAPDGEQHVPDSFSPDGQVLVYAAGGGDAGYALWQLDLATRETSVLIESQAPGVSNAVFSPDGRWLAYQAYDTGENEIFIQPFPLTGSKYQLPSRGDNHHPAWSADGRQLYYIPGPNRFELVGISTERGVTFGNPVILNQTPLQLAAPDTSRTYDIMPDGSGILGVMPANAGNAGDANRIIVVQNWFEELKAKVPTD